MKMPILEDLDRVILRNKEEFTVLTNIDTKYSPNDNVEATYNYLTKGIIDRRFESIDAEIIQLSNFNENLDNYNDSDYDIATILTFNYKMLWERYKDEGKLQVFIKKNDLTEESAMTMLEWHLK